MLTTRTVRKAIGIAALLVAMSPSSLFRIGEARAFDLAEPEQNPEEVKTIHIDAISHWLRARFSDAELATFRREDLRVEFSSCSCYDQPTAHFPYSVLLVITPKGDLVARPEARETSVSITPLAVRYGNRYCDVEAEGKCYGSFAHACEFTDFRYGPYLAQFFPTCKSEHAATLTPAAAGSGWQP